jgi:hypothetical protein
LRELAELQHDGEAIERLDGELALASLDLRQVTRIDVGSRGNCA